MGWGIWVWRYIFNVEYVRSSAGMRDFADGNQFDRLKGSSFGTNIAGVDDTISSDGDSCAVFYHLVRFEFKYNLGVGD